MTEQEIIDTECVAPEDRPDRPREVKYQKTNKCWDCNLCSKPIQVGSKVRYEFYAPVAEGDKWVNFRTCVDCVGKRARGEI